MRQSTPGGVCSAMTMHASPIDEPELIVPLHAEEFSVSVRPVVTGRVRVHVQTQERAQEVDEPALSTRVDVERVAIGRVVDAHPPVREEGATTVISVVEEVLVIERRLMLKEEIRLTRVTTQTQHRETVVLREQQATIERLPG